jgi:hypothetical protein
VITDMTSVGTPPGYFDFNAFEEIQVSTGGNDASIATGGVVLNMVTRRGTNDWRGSIQGYYTDDSLVTDSNVDQGDLAKAGPWNNNRAQPAFTQGNRIVSVEDYGIELGGPISRDHLWVWASYSAPKVSLLTIGDFEDDSTLEAGNLKLNGQVTAANSATFFAWDDEKLRRGRGAGPTLLPESTWTQYRVGDRPTALKLEDSHIFGPSFYATALWSRVNGGFRLDPQGGGAKVPFIDENNVTHHSNYMYSSERPQEQTRGEGTAFFNTGDISHELKFGASYREVEVFSFTSYPAGGFEYYGGLLFLTRDGIANFEGQYREAYVQDTLAAGNLTANVGIRYDRQGGRNLPTAVPANPIAPDLLPADFYPGGDAGFTWSDIVPRLGLTYALGKDRGTLLRASYSEYANQLDTLQGGWNNPVLNLQYRFFYTSNNGDSTVTRDQILDEWANPTRGLNPHTLEYVPSNAVDPDLSAPRTKEALLGVEHALRPNFVVGLRLDWRRLEDLGHTGRLHRREDYVPDRTTTITGPDGQPSTSTVWKLRPGIESRGGLYLRNGDRAQDFKGVFLTAEKRLSEGWLLRGYAGWQEWTWDIPEDRSNEDPTDTALGGVKDGSPVLSGRGLGGTNAYFLNSR